MNREKGPNTYFYSVGQSLDDPVRCAEIKIKRSVFICSLGFADTMENAKAFITGISRENKTATHNCWAYVIGDKGQTSHCSDAGEPSGTAGKPMLNTLTSHGMTCVAAVVTRHYGGVKLGVRGLIEAYSLSVAAAIELAPLVRLVKTVPFTVTLSYGMNDTFLNRISAFNVQVVHTDYQEQVCHELAVEAGDLGPVQSMLSEYHHQGFLEYTHAGPQDAK